MEGLEANRIKRALGEGKTSQHICFKDSSRLPSKHHLLSRTSSLKLKIGTWEWNQSQWRTDTWGTIPFLTWLVHDFKHMLNKKLQWCNIIQTYSVFQLQNPARLTQWIFVTTTEAVKKITKVCSFLGYKSSFVVYKNFSMKCS